MAQRTLSLQFTQRTFSSVFSAHTPYSKYHRCFGLHSVRNAGLNVLGGTKSINNLLFISKNLLNQRNYHSFILLHTRECLHWDFIKYLTIKFSVIVHQKPHLSLENSQLVDHNGISHILFFWLSRVKFWQGYQPTLQYRFANLDGIITSE